MATVSDDGERTCPLCAEEMDLTDQQLKPCKCGYEICVWCWHHIMDMAEKDNTEGRCPACRMPYDKEKIVGMAANCERMVAEINSERRLKQKAKSKASEGRKHLSSVRVIQRHLVYVIGLPANLADEAILERKEYFGQYGKVLKVSITWPQNSSQQASNNSTFSVYITYTKEDEAVRCIQSVHGFVLEGRSLRACFGTTKYCHTWLRNMPCNNPDCLYLHDLGTPEDSFTKDEIVSAYTRVQQITGAINNSQRRSGNVLPPPVDEVCYNSSSTAFGKSTVKNIQNVGHPTVNSSNQVKASASCSISGRSSALPAAASWGLRSSSASRQAATSVEAKQKSESVNGSLGSSSTTPTMSMLTEMHSKGQKSTVVRETDLMVFSDKTGVEAAKHVGLQTTTGAPVKAFIDSDTNQSSIKLEDTDLGIAKPQNTTHTVDLGRQWSSGSGGNEAGNVCGSIEESMQRISSQFSSTGMDSQLSTVYPDMSENPSPNSGNYTTRSNCHVVFMEERSYTDRRDDRLEPLASSVLRDAMIVPESSTAVRKQPTSDMQTEASADSEGEMIGLQLPVDIQKLNLHENMTCLSSTPHILLNAPQHSTSLPLQRSETVNTLFNADNKADDMRVDSLLPLSNSILSNDFDKTKFGSNELGCHVESSDQISGAGVKCLDNVTLGIDLAESTIISNILSSDLDALNLPQSLSNLLSGTENFNLPSPWKPQKNSQSRFSFARQDDSVVNQAPCAEDSFSHGRHVQKKHCGFNSADFAISSQVQLANEVSESYTSGLVSPNKFSVSRSQVSAPPGFSVPSRLPPPGFSSQERVDCSSVPASSGNKLLESLLPREPYQAPASGNVDGSFDDVEFFDPAILAVGKGVSTNTTSNLGLTSSLSAQLNSGHGSRLPLMQQPSMSHQNLSFSDYMADPYAVLNGCFVSSRPVEQTHGSSLSHLMQISLLQSRNSRISNGQCDSWNMIQNGGGLHLPEISRNEGLGFNKYSHGHEESKFHFTSSADLYSDNRAFGM